MRDSIEVVDALAEGKYESALRGNGGEDAEHFPGSLRPRRFVPNSH